MHSGPIGTVSTMSGGDADVGKNHVRNLFVIPAKAGIQTAPSAPQTWPVSPWIDLRSSSAPAFAGMLELGSKLTASREDRVPPRSVMFDADDPAISRIAAPNQSMRI
jgi:hypothetical protein